MSAMTRSLETATYMALLHDLLKDAHEEGIDPDEIMDGLICGFITVGINNRIEPESVFWELRQRWSTARELHASVVSSN